MSVGPSSRTSENIRNRDLTESTWIPLTLQTSQTVISSAIKPNLFKRRREGNNPHCEARFTAFHLRHTSKTKSEGLTYMATLTHRASTTTFCCKKITPLVKKYIQKSGPPLVVQESLHGVGGQGNHTAKFNLQWQTAYFNESVPLFSFWERGQECQLTHVDCKLRGGEAVPCLQQQSKHSKTLGSVTAVRQCLSNSNNSCTFLP